ncbi:SusD/RagB family nutrient-binding outer membrane lipoprotein [Arcticibacter tournemirensis]|uniref:SusD/RagB family nutrient-binding outer membrane lipoprotein n=1 Tax=Arcticibacter tournemirensis TaxID=699437 RepID=A0A4Q0M9F7_9SPHI|nr:SusD/RagB family nutrient-binding outer membrane lipoprotein [Arcticibacter tournemirensis]RXF69817.1 SusD/RagB family nutrient-binding outer membrane lipoprotein [Arcticibacter tournemirensis]
MKNRYNVLWTIILAIGILSPSCTKDFAEINTDPNGTAAATPESLLAPALLNVVNGNLTRALRISNEFMQVHVTTTDSREFHRYIIRPSESDYMWRNWYLQLTNFRDMYTNAQRTQQTSYKTFMGISLILDTWVSSMITDIYGNVPYFQSNKGREANLLPKFDNQKDIYLDMFRKLEEANVLLAENVDAPEDIKVLDPLFKGMALSWRKFGNSLYLRLLMRASGKAESGAVAKIKEIVDTKKSDYPIMTSNLESAILPIGGTTPLISEFANYRDLDFSGGKGYTEFFINNLNSWDDPRRTKWATVVGGGYIGMTSGYGTGQAPEVMSTLLLSLKTDYRLGNILNYAELQFILAEAALKGYINGSPKTFYEKGIESAISMWDVAMPVGYLDKEDVKWDDAASFDTKMDQILLQKYYALFFTDFQSWSEYRRTGHPVLPIGPGVQNDGKMPSRFRYPINTQATNSANYQEAVNAIGGDDINVKVWWNTPD